MENTQDLAIGIVATAPSPATSGTTLVLQTGQGADMPAVPFKALVYPPNVMPTKYNSEIVRVTARTSDTITITRAQGVTTTAQSIAAGWIVSNNLFAGDIKQNTARYYAFSGANQGTTSGGYVNFTAACSLTTKGGAIEAEVFMTAYVSSNTGFFALQINGVDYEVITISGSSERGMWGKVKTPLLPAGTYTIQLRGYINGGATINIPAYSSQTIFAKEVPAG